MGPPEEIARGFRNLTERHTLHESREGVRGFPVPFFLPPILKRERAEGGIDRDGGARRLWLIFAIIQSVCWCSRIPWMEGGKPISISASLSLSFFASSDSELLVIHPCMQKVCLCSVCPFPISHEKSTSCLTARGRERGGGQSSLSPL